MKWRALNATKSGNTEVGWLAAIVGKVEVGSSQFDGKLSPDLFSILEKVDWESCTA